MAKFGHELADLIFKHYPLALKGDVDQLAAVTADMATTFGGLLAFSFRLTGEKRTRGIIHAIVKLMLQQAGIIDEKAVDIAMNRGERP